VKISKRVKDTPIGNGEKNEKKASVINSPEFGERMRKKRLSSIAQNLELFDNRNKPT